MARPKGSKNKPKIEKKDNKEAIMPTAHLDIGITDLNDRESVYERANKVRSGELSPDSDIESDAIAKAIAEVEQEESEVPPVEEPVQLAEPEEVEEVEQVAQPEKEEAHGYVPEEKPVKTEKTEEKTVPIGALHEAREMYKTEREKRKEMEKRLEELENRQKESEVVDYFPEDTRYAKLENEINALKAERQREQERIQKEQEQILIDKVADELKSEGFHWFKEFGAQRLRDDFDRMMGVDPDFVMAHKNPEGWKKWYVERIYPEIKQHMDSYARESTMSKKVEAKKNSQLVTKIGSKDQLPKIEEKPQLPPEQEYLRERLMGRL